MELLGFPEPPRLTVHRERSRSLFDRHPWVYYGALKHPPKNLPAGLVVDLLDERGTFLARGGFNDASQIAVRVFTFRDEPVDAAFIRRRVAAAVARRAPLLDAETDSCRLVFGEADGLPGLIVDRYGEWLVVQILSAAMEFWRPAVIEALAELAPRGIWERSDSEDRRRHEGLGLTSGALWGEEPPDEVVIREHGLSFQVDLRGGHKTGFYLDQRLNRAAVARYCGGCRVLNAFAYTGGFGVYAARAGATAVTHVDSSAPALERCRANLERNGLSDGQETLTADVFDALKAFRAEGRTFDGIILDPPKFAASRKLLDKAARGYQDLNQQALRVLAPGGWLATFSCSGAMAPGHFREVIAKAAVAAGRDLQVVAVLDQPPDHPVLLSFPEGHYLKGLVCRVVD